MLNLKIGETKIYAAKYPTRHGMNRRNLKEYTDSQRELALKLLKANPFISRAELAEALTLTLQSLESWLFRNKDIRKILKHSDRGRGKRRKEILKILESNRTISRLELAKIFSMPPVSFYSWLQEEPELDKLIMKKKKNLNTREN